MYTDEKYNNDVIISSIPKKIKLKKMTGIGSAPRSI